ncbi:MAG TPA: phosphoesterase [Methanoculleus sp.]|jgi:oligoribonuclease NrnB/cAMP/cGMP phosphodiesterase (DHH superfamily)|uniref:DHH family phosphoesterase n=1 Tax=Methanoculleus sp. TaxID=90427 RepID=UPI000AE6E08E|nr:phosphoesterase [Methanoculleus sp.]MBP7144438.1 phosphoesterase [Methanoculleus sp.]HNT08436.1 phosphoesterase [Methanoculleus sp.]HOC84785.1 phosphoesterase [Methanoculleus sp.]HOZ43609.1 phosphoesterase [Methanoculleus sp.]HQC33735.1 phosphoesterase [Methanoculleus sp.]
MSRSDQKSGTRGTNLMQALSERTATVVHLTHNDLDAVGSDAIHRRKYGDVFTVWSSVGKFLANFDAVAGSPGRGDLLSISDIGYQPGVEQRLAKARSNGWRIEWRDHHRWKDEEVRAVEKKTSLLRIDTGTCATGIVARDLAGDDAVATEIARVVCDYDLWKHQDPRSKVLGQVVMRKGCREYVRDNLVRGIIVDEKVEDEYAGIVREMDRDIKKSLRHTTIIEGERYRIAFTPLYGYPSETAHTIRDELDTDIEVVVSSNGRISIRSVPPISHLIAREFSGGGHPHAAGGSFPFNLLDRILFWLIKRNRHYRRLAGVAESIAR